MQDDQFTSPPQLPEPQKDNKSRAVVWLAIVLGILLIVSVGITAWLWMQWDTEKQSLINERNALQSQIQTLRQDSEEQESASTPSGGETTCKDTPTVSLKENIKAALDSKNTAAFASYVSNPVRVVFAASEKGGNETPDQAATSMEYTHSATGPWDFNLPAATISGYQSGEYAEYFNAKTYVGKAASGMVAAFQFDCEGKINQIFVAAHESLL